MRIAISMTSVCICSFRSRDQQDNYGRNSVSGEGLAAVLKRKEYLLPAARSIGIREGTKTLLQAIIF